MWSLLHPRISMICLGTTLTVCMTLPAHGQETALPSDPGYRLEMNLPYRSESQGNQSIEQKCRLDLYTPSDVSNFSTVVWFHGGGLTKGEKSIPEGLKRQGIAVAAAGYRLHPDVNAPTYIEDAAAAIAWVFQNIEARGGSPKKIFISGHSAGGYLVMMTGLDRKWLERHHIDANQIAGIIPLSGQAITHFTIRSERKIPDTRPVIDDLAPLYHVRPDAPPILLITGDRNKELRGRYEENAYLWRMFREVKHPEAQLFELQGYDHGSMATPALPLLLEFVRQQAGESKP